MTFSKSKKGQGRPPALHQPTRARFSFISRFSSVLCAVALCGLMVSCGNKTETPAMSPAPQTNAAPSAAAVSPELAKLVGKWERPDGGYILEIKSVDASGKLDVAYFNPNPINVSRAAALRDKGTNKVFIELRDANYPGCTYALTHDPQSDQLYGQYFQAAMQQTFDVVFARLK
jgi:uncharacterized protein (DUF2147 family)